MVKFIFQPYSLPKQQTLDYTGPTTEVYNYLHLNLYNHTFKQNIWSQQEEVNPLTHWMLFSFGNQSSTSCTKMSCSWLAK
jgi:hypothetical protein